MSTKVEGKSVETLRMTPSAGPAKPKGPGFGAVLAGARPILKGAEAVASVLPGGPLLSAAVRAAPALASSGVPMGGGGGGVPIAPRLGAVAAPGSAGPVASAGGTPGADAPPIEGVLADSQQFNLYYLQLQEEISAENRQYSALSNVLKARHDTVKNAIGNIR